MNSMTRVVCLVSILLCGSLHAAQRTFVSAANGSDSNPCTRSQPCRNFTAALVATDVNGEIIVLDSGGYGAVTVNRGVSIISPSGVFAGIAAFSGAAVSVAVPASEIVTLRGLSLNALGGNTAIDFPGGAVLHVENCVINGFPTRGINVNRSAASDAAEVFVNDTTIRNGSYTPSGANSASGVFLRSLGAGGVVHALLRNLSIDRYYVVLWASDNSIVTIAGSNISRSEFGITVSAVTGTASLHVENCLIVDNDISGALIGDGIFQGAAVTVNIENSLFAENLDEGVAFAPHGTCYMSFTTVTRNNQGLVGSPLISLGNNRVFNNVTDGSFSSTIAQQ